MRRSHRSSPRAARSLLLLVAALAPPVAGCKVVGFENPYYAEGPHQVDPPDGFLPVGEHIMVLGTKDSYTRFLTWDGRSGYIWTAALLSPGEWQARADAAAADEDTSSFADFEATEEGAP